MRPSDFIVQLTTASEALNDDDRWERLYLEKEDEYYCMKTQQERLQEAQAAKKTKTKVGRGGQVMQCAGT